MNHGGSDMLCPIFCAQSLFDDCLLNWIMMLSVQCIGLGLGSGRSSLFSMWVNHDGHLPCLQQCLYDSL